MKCAIVCGRERQPDQQARETNVLDRLVMADVSAPQTKT